MSFDQPLFERNLAFPYYIISFSYKLKKSFCLTYTFLYNILFFIVFASLLCKQPNFRWNFPGPLRWPFLLAVTGSRLRLPEGLAVHRGPLLVQ